ncbi:MAG: hypothetical protein ACYTAO_12775 [Planctomycetota bacterium]|jgi:hypothetical protein
MSIEWLLTKAQGAEVHKGTSQRTRRKDESSGKVCETEETDSHEGRHQPADAPPAEHEADSLSPVHFRCRCGYEGNLSRGETEVQYPTKGENGVVCFECTNCGRHLQYDCLTGTIKVRKGVLGVFLDRFS